MKNVILKICLITFLFYGCEEILFEDDISESIININSPNEGAIFDTEFINFNWQMIDGVEGYQLQIATPTFLETQQIVLDTLLTINNFDFELLPNEYQWRVRGMNSAYTSNYTTSSFNIISLNPDDIVTLKTPENKFISNSLEQHLTWEQVEFAESYIIQIWKPDTSGILMEESEVVENETMVTFEEGTFIWQVSAINNQVQTAFTSRSITIDKTSPNTPQLIMPAENQNFTGKTIEFSWERMALEGSVEVDSLFVFKNEALTELVFKDEVNEAEFPLELDPNKYYWYVKSSDVAGNEGESSEVFSFTILEGIADSMVELVSPVDNLITNKSSHNLVWEAIENVESYNLQVVNSSDDSEIFIDISTLEIEKDISFQDGSYKWQVKGLNSIEETAFYSRSILVDTKSPNTPDLVAPIDLYTQVDKIIHFQFDRTTIEGSVEVDSLFVFSDIEKQNLILKSEVTDGSYYKEFDFGAYFWYVKSFDEAGNESEQSEMFSFIIEEGINTKSITLLSPVDELISNNSLQTFKWDILENALEYRLQVYQLNSNIIEFDYALPITEKTITLDDGYYTWQVRGQNNSGNTGYSKRSILIDTTSPDISELQNPVNEAVLNNTTVQFVWNRDSGISSETSALYVYFDEELSDLAFKKQIAKNYLYKDLAPNIYYWYVITSDAAGNTSEVSKVFSFTIE